MHAKVNKIVQRIRKERFTRIQPMIRGGRIPSDSEAVLLHCKSCKNAAIHLQEIPAGSEFKSLGGYERHLKRVSVTESCGKCGKETAEFKASLYCQFRRKDRIDLQFVAIEDKVTGLYIVDPKGFYWPLPLDFAKDSLDEAIARTPRPNPCHKVGEEGPQSAGPDKKKQQERFLANVQKFLVEFEENRVEDPAIFGPSSLPAPVLNQALKAYAELPDNEAPLVVISTNTSAPGADGLLLSSAKLYGSEIPDHIPIPFQDIDEVEIRKGLLGSGIFVNNTKVLSVKGFKEPNAKLISFVLKQLSKAGDAEPEASKPTGTKRAPAIKKTPKPTGTQSPRKRPPHEPAGTGAGKVRQHTRRPIDDSLQKRIKKGSSGAFGVIPRAQLEALFRSLGERKVPGDLLHVIDIPAEFITIAKRSYARSLQDEKPMALIKANLGEDSAQALITEYSVYSNELFTNAPRGLKFDEIFAVELLDDEGEQMLDLNGQPFLTQGRLPDWVLPKLCEVLKVATGDDSKDEDEPEQEPVEEGAPPRQRPSGQLIPPPKVGPGPRPNGPSDVTRPGPRRGPPSGPRPGRGPGPNRPPSNGPTAPPRRGRSGVTAPPRHRPSERVPQVDGAGRGPRRPGSRVRTPKGIDLNLIDFDVELVDEANKLFLSGRFEDALRLVQEAQTVNPLNASLTYGQAAILAALGERTAALDSLLQAIRFGYASREQILADQSWQSFRQDPDFVKLMRRIDQRGRSREGHDLEQIRLGFMYLLAHMTQQLPAEVRVIFCPNCDAHHLDPAQIDYDFMWNTTEGFHLEAIAPLAMEDLSCDTCASYDVEVMGTIHSFPMGDGAFHLIFWLSGGQLRSRYLFQSDNQGYITELRSFYDVENADYGMLEAANESLLLRLESPHPEVVECAIRDMGYPGNVAVLDILYDQLSRAADSVDAQYRCNNPWLVREILESLITIGEPEALDAVFQTVAQLLSHDSIDEALAFAVVDTIVALGEPQELGSLFDYVHENVNNVAPDVIGIFLVAIMDNAENQGDHALADEAQAICQELGIA